MIKKLPGQFLEKILDLFNLCIEKSSVPDSWKISRITMIPKKKISSDPTKYRPISVTSCLGKVLERIVTNRLYRFLESKGLISKAQSGFRQHRRTSDNLVFLSQKVGEALLRKKKACGLFFDIMKAFDKVSHNGIIFKMTKIQVPLYIVEYVRNFLSSRKFFVKLNNFESAQGDIFTGVPQGAVISPILFSIFINDIPQENQKNKSYSLLFADDLLTFFIFKRYGNIKWTIKKYLKKIETWLSKWKMKMAPDKCTHMIFSGNPGKNKPLEIQFLGKSIPYEKNPVFLGIKKQM